jgi:aspartyl-tRNA(Asn)/glutamyl-tRNA(Gln) amidotransferase subunit B
VALNDTYESVIGLEVHAQLLTETKAFCGCPTAFGAAPNANVCPVCLGLPGALPVLNRKAVEFALRLGLALGSTITSRSSFARKNYFYPDLPKGYQISQFEFPLCRGGAIEIESADGTRRRIGIHHAHLEEDAGKSIHDRGSETLVDVNRCGVPLVEIVTEPDIRSPRDAALALAGIRRLVTYLEICDGNMEEGSLRCDANVSVRRRGEQTLGTKTEVKNMNSFRNVERALEYEIQRQMSLVDDGGTVQQETLLWDAERGVALPMRSKEESRDYRYFPDPDLVPVVVDETWVGRIREGLPELPGARRDRFVETLGLPRYDAEVLTAERGTAEYFEEALGALAEATGLKPPAVAKPVSNWVMTEILRVAGERNTAVRDSPVSPRRLAGLLALIHNGTISGSIAKEVFGGMLAGADAESVVREKGLVMISDGDAIHRAVSAVLEQFPVQAEQYRAGQAKLFGFFMGEVMKQTGGKANPRIVTDLLRKELESPKG